MHWDCHKSHGQAVRRHKKHIVQKVTFKLTFSNINFFEVRNRVKIHVFSHVVTFWNLWEKKWNYENTTGIF